MKIIDTAIFLKQFHYLNMDFKKGDCLFGAVKLTKNADHNKYGYSG